MINKKLQLLQIVSDTRLYSLYKNIIHYDLKIQTVLQVYVIQHTGKGDLHSVNCLNLRLGRTNQNPSSYLSSNIVYQSW